MYPSGYFLGQQEEPLEESQVAAFVVSHFADDPGEQHEALTVSGGF
jgi:hypothetical protein